MLTALQPADGEAILPLALLKARVRVLDDSEDGDIRRMRLQAIDHIERYAGIALDRRQFRYDDKQFCHRIELPVGPVTSVDSIAYDDTDGAQVDLTDADWRSSGGYVMPAAGARWPLSIGDPGSVRITFTAGLTDAETQAPLLISAVEVAVAELFNNRERPDWTAAENVAASYRMPGL